MEKIFNEAYLLKDDLQLIKRVMGAMKKKLDLCLRSDEAQVEGLTGIYRRLKKQTFCYFYVAIIVHWCNFKKNDK